MRAQLALVQIGTGKMEVLTFRGSGCCQALVAELIHTRTMKPDIFPAGVLVWGCEDWERDEIDETLMCWFDIEE